MNPISATSMYHRLYAAASESPLVHSSSAAYLKHCLNSHILTGFDGIKFFKNRAEVIVYLYERRLSESESAALSLQTREFLAENGDVMIHTAVEFKVSWPSYGSRSHEHAQDMHACLTEALLFISKIEKPGEILAVESRLLTAAEALSNKIARAKHQLKQLVAAVCQVHFQRKRKIGASLVMFHSDLDKMESAAVTSAVNALRACSVNEATDSFTIMNDTVNVVILLTKNDVSFSAKKIA